MKLSSGKLEFTTKSSDKFSLLLQPQITGKIGKENHTIWTKRSGNNPHPSMEMPFRRERLKLSKLGKNHSKKFIETEVTKKTCLPRSFKFASIVKSICWLTSMEFHNPNGEKFVNAEKL